MKSLKEKAVEQAVQLYNRSIGDGDLSVENLFPYSRYTKAEIRCTSDFYAAGILVHKQFIEKCDPSISFTSPFLDKAEDAIAKKGDLLATMEGNGRVILSTWKVMKSVLLIMSEVIKKTKPTVEILRDSHIGVTHLLNLPIGYGKIIGYSVAVGGGVSLGTSSDDIIVLSREHFEWVGSLGGAVAKTIEEVGEVRSFIKVIVEIENADEISEIKDQKMNYVYCKGFSLEDVKKTAQISGGFLSLIVDETISLEEIPALRDYGVRLYGMKLPIQFPYEAPLVLDIMKQ